MTNPRAPYIIDAGPAINFLATGNQRLLIAAINGPFHAPQAVKDEVIRKTKEEPRFARAKTEWDKIEENWIRVLPDRRDPNLDRIARILTRAPLPKPPSKAKDLGETYVVAHATQVALAGHPVYVIIDDQGAQTLTAVAQRHLSAQRRINPNVSTITLVDTETILVRNIKGKYIPDKATMRRIYNQIRNVDRGRPQITATDLLTHPRWQQP